MDTEEQINENLQQLRQENNDAHAKIFEYLEKQNGRVRELEKWRSYLTGALAFLTFGIIVAGTVFSITLSG